MPPAGEGADVNAVNANQKTALQREVRTLKNLVQELKGNVRVFCRLRPPLARLGKPDLLGEHQGGSIRLVGENRLFLKRRSGDRESEFAFDKEKDDMIRAYFPGEFNSLTGAHDAHFDVLASIAELNFYRQHSEIHWPADA